MSAFAGTLNIDAGRLHSALLDFSRYSRKDSAVILQDTGRNFVKRVVAITPPSQGKANSAARAAGEAAVESDLHQIFDPLKTSEWAAFLDDAGGLRIVPTHRENHRGAAVTDLSLFLKKGEMAAFHDRLRKPNGRVRRINRDNLIGRKKSDISEIGFVTDTAFAWFLRTQKKKVGKLAGGWNAAGQKLGYSAPSWIRRHGTGRGQCLVDLTGGTMRIVIANEIPFVGDVRGLERNVQIALDQQAEALEKRVAYFLEHRGRAIK